MNFWHFSNNGYPSLYPAIQSISDHCRWILSMIDEKTLNDLFETDKVNTMSEHGISDFYFSGTVTQATGLRAASVSD